MKHSLFALTCTFFLLSCSNSTNVTIYEEFINDTTGELTYHTKTDNIYNSADSIIEKKVSKWNRSSKSWVLATKTIYDYNFNDQCISEENFNWNKHVNQWLGEYKIEFKYDNNGNQDEITDYEISSDYKDWQPRYKNNMKYNDLGDIIYKYENVWNARLEEWEVIGKSRCNYEYDSLSNITKKKKLEYHKTEGWEIREEKKYKRKYNENQIQIEVIEFYVDGYDKWTPNYKWQFINSEISKTTLCYKWNHQVNSWIGENKDFYKLDNEGKEVEQHYFLWDSYTKSFRSVERRKVSIHDKNGKETNWEIIDDYAGVIEKFDSEYNSNGQILSQSSYKSDRSTNYELKLVSRTTYKYN
ncbi:MAG: hypothetical protein N4A71_00355 [Carboxylicivirga sp.]|jgi:hypothetical protein|nr:hypothetical protein [Carboxylicivirga sp.]